MDKRNALGMLMGAMGALGVDPSMAVGSAVRGYRPARSQKSVADRIREAKTLDELTALLAEVQKYPNVKAKTIKRWNLEIEAAKKRLT